MIARCLLPWLLCSIGFVVAAEPCRPVEGLAPLLGAGKVLLLGEVHGTVDSPAFASDVACHAGHAGLSVILGLEIVSSEQARVNAFLDSAGTDKDVEALLAGRPWQADYQDGRASRAMFELIDSMRRLRAKQLPVQVVLFDDGANRDGQQRDRKMAAKLTAAIEAAPAAMTVALTGNLHSRTTRGTPRRPEYEPMGYLLKQALPAGKLTALNAAHRAGSAWVCAPDCGVADFSGRRGESTRVIEIDDATRPAGHQGWYQLGTVTASMPARFSPAEVAAHTRLPQSPVASAPPVDPPKPAPAGNEPRIEGDWQAEDFSSHFKMWRIRFDDPGFHAEGGEDDWYKGRFTVRPEESPSQIDFAIEDCICSYKGMTSRGIYFWDGDSLVVSAPTPGKPRPSQFVKSSGQMIRLVPLPEK